MTNSIRTEQARNMHALWDQLLGPRFDYGDVKRRVLEITGDGELGAKLDALKATDAFLTPGEPPVSDDACLHAGGP